MIEGNIRLAAEQESIIRVLISLAVLLFAAKIFAELFNKLRLPAVLGELLAGIIMGPFALGSLSNFDGKPLVILNETVRQIGEIAGVVILFIAGLHITPKEFPKIPERRSCVIYDRSVWSYCSVLLGILCFHNIRIGGITVYSHSDSTYCN